MTTHFIDLDFQEAQTDSEKNWKFDEEIFLDLL
jgi:hypothetical protein